MCLHKPEYGFCSAASCSLQTCTPLQTVFLFLSYSFGFFFTHVPLVTSQKQSSWNIWRKAATHDTNPFDNINMLVNVWKKKSFIAFILMMNKTLHCRLLYNRKMWLTLGRRKKSVCALMQNLNIALFNHNSSSYLSHILDHLVWFNQQEKQFYYL